jgi:hypothetical protein
MEEASKRMTKSPDTTTSWQPWEGMYEIFGDDLVMCNYFVCLYSLFRKRNNSYMIFTGSLNQ